MLDNRDIRKLEKEAASSYEHLARDFYNPALHPTTHVFGLAIEEQLRNDASLMIPGGCYLEVGAGRSRIAMFAPRNTRLILSDISMRMLLHSRGLRSNAIISMLVSSAFHLPVRDKALDGVFALLGDAFGIEPFFRESARVIKTGGFLYYVAPAAAWGCTVRKLLGVGPDVTPLMDDKEQTLLVPSILTADADLTSLVNSVGFFQIAIKDLHVPSVVSPQDIPKHISIVAQHQGADPYDVPILTLLRAYKATL